MAKQDKDDARENRISLEVIVDAYGEEEQALGWYYYLEEKMTFPFKARCIRERSTSPLRKGEAVVVDGMAAQDDCEHDMFVMITWNGRALAVPLSQLEAPQTDEETVEAIGDWHYWVDQGYEFG